MVVKKLLQLKKFQHQNIDYKSNAWLWKEGLKQLRLKVKYFLQEYYISIIIFSCIIEEIIITKYHNILKKIISLTLRDLSFELFFASVATNAFKMISFSLRDIKFQVNNNCNGVHEQSTPHQSYFFGSPFIATYIVMQST